MQRFVNPTPFGINMGIEYLFMAVVGGVGTSGARCVGAGVITLLKQCCRTCCRCCSARSGNFEIVVFGILMVLMLQYARDGLWPFVARAAAAAPRRKVDVAPTRRPLPRAAARRRTARRRCSTCSDARKRFGGLVAVNDVSFAGPRRRDPRPDRPQRRRQETMFNLISGVLPLTARPASRSSASASTGLPSRRSRAAASAAHSST